MDTLIETEKRLIDANLNRIREGIRVIEDIARYILNDLSLATSLKTLRHKARIGDSKLLELLLQHRDIKNDILKKSTPSENTRANLREIAIANFKRSEESARVLEEIFKLDSMNDLAVDSVDLCESSANLSETNANRGADSRESSESSVSDNCGTIAETFKAIRYELYDIEIAYFKALDKII